MKNEEIIKKAHEATEKASKETGFIKYKGAPENSVFFSLYEQIFKIAEISAYTELKKGNSMEEATRAASVIMERNINKGA